MNSGALYSALVIGIGNPERGDDGVGLVVAHLVGIAALPCVRVLEHSGEGTDLIEQWRHEEASCVYLIDAACSGAPAGSVFRFEAHDEPLPARLFTRSTHTFGVAQAVELARVLGCLPLRTVVYAIEGMCFEQTHSLSKNVEAAAHDVATSIVRELYAAQQRN